MTEPVNPFHILTPAQIQQCEQFAAHARASLNAMCDNVIQDINHREQKFGIRDDSVTVYLTWEFVKRKMMEPGGPEFTAMLLASALNKLARARMDDHQ